MEEPRRAGPRVLSLHQNFVKQVFFGTPLPPPLQEITFSINLKKEVELDPRRVSPMFPRVSCKGGQGKGSWAPHLAAQAHYEG